MIYDYVCASQWRIQDFPQGGAPTPKIATIFQFFAENCMKMKEFGPPGGGARVPGAPPWIRQCFMLKSSKFTVCFVACHVFPHTRHVLHRLTYSDTMKVTIRTPTAEAHQVEVAPQDTVRQLKVSAFYKWLFTS